MQGEGEPFVGEWPAGAGGGDFDAEGDDWGIGAEDWAVGAGEHSDTGGEQSDSSDTGELGPSELDREMAEAIVDGLWERTLESFGSVWTGTGYYFAQQGKEIVCVFAATAVNCLFAGSLPQDCADCELMRYLRASGQVSELQPDSARFNWGTLYWRTDAADPRHGQGLSSAAQVAVAQHLEAVVPRAQLPALAENAGDFAPYPQVARIAPAFCAEREFGAEKVWGGCVSS